MDEMKQFIQFKLGLDDYAVEMSCVREIIKPMHEWNTTFGCTQICTGDC